MKNKTGRILLEKIYGKGCFIERAGIREINEDEEKLLKRQIKGYKRLNRTITYHHLKKKEYGGIVSIDNGANIAAYNHEWLHQQPPEKQEEINNQLREFKYKIDCAKVALGDKNINFEKLGNIDFSLNKSDYISIPVYDNTEIDLQKRKKFNRAREKDEFQKMVKDYYEDRR